MTDSKLEARRGVGVQPGQFGHNLHEDQGDDVSLVQSNAPSSWKDFLAEKYQLSYVDYRDELEDDDLASWLGAKTCEEAYDAVSTVDDAYWEQRSDASWQEALDVLLRAHVSEHPEDKGCYSTETIDSLYDAEAIDQIREEIEARSSGKSEWQLLAGNSGRKLVRASLGVDIDPPATLLDDDGAEFERAEREIAEAAGIDFDANEPAIRELLINSYYGGHLYVMWSTDGSDLAGDSTALPPSSVSIENPQLLVLDGWNGSGWTVKTTGRLDKSVDRLAGEDGIVLDNKSGGYGWGQVSGAGGRDYKPDSIEYGFDRAEQ